MALEQTLEQRMREVELQARELESAVEAREAPLKGGWLSATARSALLEREATAHERLRAEWEAEAADLRRPRGLSWGLVARLSLTATAFMTATLALPFDLGPRGLALGAVTAWLVFLVGLGSRQRAR